MARWENNRNMQDNVRERDQLMSLKVMRLTRPNIKALLPVTAEDGDLCGTIFQKDMENDISAIKGIEMFASSEMLTLPQSFGSIYLGETFSSYVSVLNDSNQIVKDVLVKMDLQTSSQRFQLATSAPCPQLAPDESLDEVINYEVKELGTHILICAVSYTSGVGEKLYMRKFFKFQVLKPLEVKTKFYNYEDSIYLEAQVQNITAGPMCMVEVSLDPSPYYSVKDLNHSHAANVEDENTDTEDDNSKGLTFGSSYLNPMDTRQYLYLLMPKKESSRELQSKSISPVGKLDIVWRTNFGEIGRLQTSQLQRILPSHQDLKIIPMATPDVVRAEEEFKIKCRLQNFDTSKIEAKLFLTDPKHGGLLWSGVSGRVLGTVASGSFIDFELTMLATQIGLQLIGGIKILDMNSTKVFEFDNIATVLVYGTEESPFR